MKSFRIFLEENNHKILWIMRGVAGSGKSHKAKQLAGSTGAIFGTDDYWEPNYVQNFNAAIANNTIQQKLSEYHQKNYERAIQAMQKGITPIVIDNTNIRKRDFERYVQAGESLGYEVRFAESDHPEWKKIRPFIPHDVEKMQQAAQFFHRNNQHGVPANAIYKMMSSFEESSLRQLLQPVPQSPHWHKEGNVFKHTQLVRGGLGVAVDLLTNAAADPNSAFSNLDMNLTPQDLNMLRLGGWLHDVGKPSATMIGDKPWNSFPAGQEPNEPITAHNHEDDVHFEPMMQKLGQPWQNMHQNANPQDKENLWYLIRNHMSLKNGLWSKKLWADLIDANGKYKNEQRVKLLLLLVLMDKMGRFGNDRPQFGMAQGLEALRDMQATADKAKKIERPKMDFNSKEDFIAHLKNKGLSQNIIDRNVKAKYGSQ